MSSTLSIYATLHNSQARNVLHVLMRYLLGIQVPRGDGFHAFRHVSECNSDEQFRSIAEIASAETRARRRIAGYRDNLYARD